MEKDFEKALNELDHGVNIMANHLNNMTHRVIHAEMALDVFLGIMFEDEELKKTFEEKFTERMEEVKATRDASMQQAQESAAKIKEADGDNTEPFTA